MYPATPAMIPTMPRLKSIEPIQAHGRAAELLAGPLKGRHSNMVKALASAPAALEALLALEHALDADKANSAAGAALSPEHRRLVLLTLNQAHGSHYDVAAHVAKARALNISEARITQARRGSADDPANAPADHALIRFALAIHEKLGRISDRDAAAFLDAGFAPPAIAEVVALHALATFSCTFNLVNQTPVDSPPAPELAS